MATSITMRIHPKLPTALREIGLSEGDIKKREKRTLQRFTAWGIREIQKSMTSSGQGQPGGAEWKELSDGYAAFKSLMGWSSLIGVAKGWMKQSVSGDIDTNKGQSMIGVGGRAEGYAERFNRNRPLLPEDNYAADRLQKLYFESLRARV